MTAPRAAHLQGGSNGADEPLVLAARRRQPNRKWWWGIRTRDGHTGAWCYLCDTFMATWSGTWPVTVQARIEIGLHRQSHIQGRLDTPAAEDKR